MNREINGVVSLGLVASATAVAAIAMFRVSWILGLVYLAANATTPFEILYFYCAKCPCKENCLVAETLPGVLEVQTYGDILHLLVDSAEERLPEIKAALREKGIAYRSIRRATPRMEEAFISLIKRMEQKES